MTMMPTMTEVFSPDGKESRKVREDAIPEGWLRTCPEIKEPIQVDPKGTEYPIEVDNGPQDSEPDPKLNDEEEKEFQEMLDADRNADPKEYESER